MNTMIEHRQMKQNFLTTYTADPLNPFWTCAVKGCQIPFPHEVGMTEDHKWKHMWADAWAEPMPTPTTEWRRV